MTAIKGYADQKKTSGGMQYATIGPVRQGQNGMDVIAHTFMQEIGTDAVEANSTTTSIVATAHAALVGDVISFTSGNLNKIEVRVGSVSTDAIGLCETLSEAPAAADTFKILRPKFPEVDSQGRIDVGVTFSNDNDWGTVGADTLRTASIVGNEDGLADFGAGNASAQTLRVVVATDQAVLPVSDNGDSITVDGAVTVSATNLDIRDLTSAADSVAAVQSGTWNIGDISGTVSLPTGAATEAAQTTGNTALAAIQTAVEALDNAVSGNELQVDVVTLPVANIAYTAKGKIAGTSLTGSYATLLDPTSDLRILAIFNDCDASILVSLDGGSTDTFELNPGESLTLDLAMNGLKFANAVNISAKHNGAAPTAGSVRASGIG